MATMEVEDRLLRDWATEFGYPVGTRGPISLEIQREWLSYQRLTPREQVLRLRERLAELADERILLLAERCENEAIIRAMGRTIEHLRSRLADATAEAEGWKNTAIDLAGTRYGEV